MTECWAYGIKLNRPVLFLALGPIDFADLLTDWPIFKLKVEPEATHLAHSPRALEGRSSPRRDPGCAGLCCRSVASVQTPPWAPGNKIKPYDASPTSALRAIS